MPPGGKTYRDGRLPVPGGGPGSCPSLRRNRSSATAPGGPTGFPPPPGAGDWTSASGSRIFLLPLSSFSAVFLLLPTSCAVPAVSGPFPFSRQWPGAGPGLCRNRTAFPASGYGRPGALPPSSAPVPGICLQWLSVSLPAAGPVPSAFPGIFPFHGPHDCG